MNEERNAMLRELVRTIEDDPDPLHFDVTPSVRALIAEGMAALPAIVPLLSSDAASLRRRAQTVLEEVIAQVAARGTHGSGIAAQQAWTSLWRDSGAYRWDAPEEERAASIAQLEQWMRDQPPAGMP